METRSLAAGAPALPVVGLGCNNFGGRLDLEATRKVIERALELGVNHLDTADIYGHSKSEVFIGEVLGARRKQVFLATKFGKMADAVPGVRGSAAYVKRACEASLKRLATDWIDLYYMHEPDPQTPVAETLGALEDLRKAGKIRYAATSNFNADEVTGAVAAAKRLHAPGFVAAQDEYSLIARGIETSLLPALDANGFGLIPYFPLAGGALTGKYRKNAPAPHGTRLVPGSSRFLDPNWDKLEALHAFAESRGRTTLELAFSWLARRPRVVSIIAGATKPEQVDANVKATGWNLTPAEMAEVDRITKA